MFATHLIQYARCGTYTFLIQGLQLVNYPIVHIATCTVDNTRGAMHRGLSFNPKNAHSFYSRHLHVPVAGDGSPIRHQGNLAPPFSQSIHHLVCVGNIWVKMKSQQILTCCVVVAVIVVMISKRIIVTKNTTNTQRVNVLCIGHCR